MKRTNQQGDAYFGFIIPQIGDFYRQNQILLVKDLMRYVEKKTGKEFNYDKEFLHEVSKLMFNDGESTRFEDKIINGELISGTIQMNNYWDRIREHFMDVHHFEIRLPGEAPLEDIQFIQ